MFGSSSKTQKFHLSASPCAPEGYPAMIQLGNFIRSDGKTFPVPSGHFLDGDWGVTFISWSVGEENQPAPDSLEILWYAFAEDKFYEGQFALPQKQIHAKLKEGYWNSYDNKQESYEELSVCVLPKGGVVVWLSAQNKVLVGRFQGQEAAVSFARYYPKSDRAKMVREEQIKLPAEVQRHIAAGTISAQQWDEYLRTYPWKVELHQPEAATPPTAYDYSIDYLSGERTRYPITRDMVPYLKALLSPTAKAVPKELTLYVKDEWGRKRRLDIDAFDEAQTQGAFQVLHKAAPSSPITLGVDVNQDFTAVRLLLRNAAKEVELTKTPVKIVNLN